MIERKVCFKLSYLRTPKIQGNYTLNEGEKAALTTKNPPGAVLLAIWGFRENFENPGGKGLF